MFLTVCHDLIRSGSPPPPVWPWPAPPQRASGTTAVYANAVAGLLVVVAGLAVLVAGFELAGCWFDGIGPPEADACFVAAFLPLGG